MDSILNIFDKNTLTFVNIHVGYVIESNEVLLKMKDILESLYNGNKKKYLKKASIDMYR